MTLFRLDATIRKQGSHSRAIADLVEHAWQTQQPDTVVIRRPVGLTPIPSTTWPLAVAAHNAPPDTWTANQQDAVQHAALLTDELLASDSYLFAIPIYNFGVSQHFKTWADVVITDPRMVTAKDPALAGRPAVLVVVRGGAYGPGTPREGWDHATSWYTRILTDVWGLDLRTVELEFTLAEQNPALAEFIPLSRRLRTAAEQRATELGPHLTRNLASSQLS